MKNGHKIILKFKWVSGSAVSLALAVVHDGALVGVQGGKTPEKI